jgi:hypothetical protein
MVEVEARRAEAGPASKAPVLVLRHEKAPVKVVSFEELETNWRRKRWPPKENRPYQSAYEPSTLEPVISAYDEPLVAGRVLLIRQECLLERKRIYVGESRGTRWQRLDTLKIRVKVLGSSRRTINDGAALIDSRSLHCVEKTHD